MDDLEILKQLLNGNYLSPQELNKARGILHYLNLEVKGRVE